MQHLRERGIVGKALSAPIWAAAVGGTAGLADGVYLYSRTAPGPADARVLFLGVLIHAVVGLVLGFVLAGLARVVVARDQGLAGDEPRIWAGGLAVTSFFVGSTILANWVWAPRGSTWKDPEGLTSVGLCLAFSVFLARAHLASLRATPFLRATLGRLARWPYPTGALVVVLGIPFLLPDARERFRPPGGARPRAGETAAPVGVPRPYAVIVIVADTLRPDRLSCYGYARETSPAMDRLAREGVLFRHAYSSSSWSVPGHASLFTGLYPDGHGADVDEDGSLAIMLAPENRTLAEVLRERGYPTVSCIANPLAGSITGLDQGFCSVEEAFERRLRVLDFLLVRVLERVFPLRFQMLDVPGVTNYGDGSRVTDSAVRWIEEKARGGPFLLFINYLDAHDPQRLPSDPRSRFFDPPGSYDVDEHWRILRRAHDRGRVEPLRESERKFLSDAYDGAVHYVDEQVGQIVAALERADILDQAVLVVTADHGEAIGEHDTYGHLKTLHEEEVRIPLVVRFPGGRGGGRFVETPVSIVDVFPTVLETLGIESDPQSIDGRSLESPIERPILLRVGVVGPGRPGKGDGAWYACRVGRMKLLVDNADHVHLYDVTADPWEEIDLAESRPAQVRELMAILFDEVARARRNAPAERPRATEDLRRRLVGMGYLK